MSKPSSDAFPKHPLRQPDPGTAQPSKDVLCFSVYRGADALDR